MMNRGVDQRSSKVPEVTLIFWVMTICVTSSGSTKAKFFYGITIWFARALGRAVSAWTADTAGLGYVGSAVVFGAVLGLVIAAYCWTSTSRTQLFWAAFILTRPLGAV